MSNTDGPNPFEDNDTPTEKIGEVLWDNEFEVVYRSELSDDGTEVLVHNCTLDHVGTDRFTLEEWESRSKLLEIIDQDVVDDPVTHTENLIQHLLEAIHIEPNDQYALSQTKVVEKNNND